MISDEEDDQKLLEELHKLEEQKNAIQQKKNLRKTQSFSQSTLSNKNLLPTAVENLEYLKGYTITYESENIENEFDNSSVKSYDECSDDNLQKIINLNQKLLDAALAARDKMQSLLEICIQRKRVVQEQIVTHSSSWQAKIVSFNAGMPYFKDKNYYTAKMNDDTATKIKKGELRLAQLPRIHRWNQHDKSNLLKSVRHEVALTLSNKVEPDENYIDNSIKKTSQLPLDVKQAIGSIGQMKFDWLKISNNMPDNKHSAEECEVMWNVFLHPDISKQKWTSKEDRELNRIVEEYDFENWDAIAKALNTKRSGYQCFVRYNTNNWKNLMKGQLWTPFDDKTLSFLVSKLRIGDYVPWGYIASCMNNWTKQQVYFRWNYSLAPHLKKGRFSPEEDEQLMKAVTNHGLNFSKIAALVMTNRTHVQLKEHYQTLTTRTSFPKKIWTYEDDAHLVKLYKKHGAKWWKIVKEIPDVNRVQARQRYSALMRYQKKGVNWKNISRPESSDLAAHTTVTFTTNNPWSWENKEILVHHMKIDEQLINFFKHEISMNNEKEQSKIYPVDKLKTDTKKLFNTLVKLNVNIKVPEYVEDKEQIPQKYLELLSCLASYVEERKNNKDKIERVRFQMFGHQKPLPENERFIPPLPFNFCAPKNILNKKNVNSKEINSPIHNDSQQIEVTMNLQSEKEVSNCLGEDVEIQFEKLKRLVVDKTSQKNRRDILYPVRCKEFAKSKTFNKESSETNTNNIYSPKNSKRMRYDWKVNKMIPTDSTEKGEVEKNSIPISVFEPSKSTLETYQKVLLISSNFPVESGNSESENYKLSPRGREALRIFKRRYQQLFHMPTGLSRIIPPDVVDESAFLPALEKLKKKSGKRRKAPRKRIKYEKHECKDRDDDDDDDEDEDEDEDEDDDDEDDDEDDENDS